MPGLSATPTEDLRRARRNAAVGGASVGAAVALLALVGPALLIALSIVLVLVGAVLSVTVIGLVLGLPLIAIGVLGLIGGAIGASAGPFVALLLGLGSGLVYYGHRVRRLDGAERRH